MSATRRHASVSRAHTRVRFGWGMLPLHAVKRRFREQLCMLFRTTSMRTGEDNRIALMPPAFYSCSRSTFDMYRACYVFALALCSLVLRICLATWVNSGSGAVGRGLQSEDAVVVFVRSCGSVCNKPTIHTLYAYSPRLSGAYVKAVRVRDSHPHAIRSAHHHIIIQKVQKFVGEQPKAIFSRPA